MAKQPIKQLTDKQKMFCDEYLIDFNGARAAIAAGYSTKTAKQIATENLSKPYLRDYLNEKKEKLTKKVEITTERIVNQIAMIAFNDKRELIDEAMKEEDKEVRAALLSQILGSSKEADQLKALDMLGRYKGIYEVDNSQSKPETILNVTRKIIK